MTWKDISNKHFAEKMLWLSVLRRAIFDYVLYKGVGKYKRRWQLARRYIFQEDIEYDDTLGFQQVCDLFGWESGHIRRMCSSLRRSDIKKLEAMRFRADFDPGTMLQPIKELWVEVEAPVPFLAPHNYSKDYQAAIRLHRVETKSVGPKTLAPLVSWSSAQTV